LARAFEGQGRFAEAFVELRKAVDLDPKNLDARVKLGHYYLTPKELRPDFVQAAERLAQEVLSQNASHIEGRILMAAVRLAQNRPDEARQELQRAVALNPQRMESHLALARFCVKVGDAANAEAAFRKAIEVNGKAALPQLEYGKFLAQQNRLDQAEAAFRQALSVEPQNRDAHQALAAFLFATKQLDKAEQAYQAFANSLPGPEGRAALADFYAANGRLDDAANAYRQLLQQHPDFANGRTRLGEILLEKGDLSGASAQADELFKKGDASAAGYLLRARVRLNNGDSRGAQGDLEESLKIDQGGRDSLYYLALTHFRAGQIEQATTFTNELEQRYPDDLPAKLMRLQIKLYNGDTRDTVESANKLLTQIDDSARQGAMLPQAIADLRARALTARATAYLQSGNVTAARSDYGAVRDTQPNSPSSYNNLAQLARQQKQWSEAAGYYEKALSLDPDNFDAWSGNIAVAAELKNVAQLNGRLAQLVASQPNSAPMYFLQGQAFAAEDRNSEAENTFKKSLQVDADYVAAYAALAALYLNQGQDDAALAQYQNIITRRPGDANTYVLMGLVEDRRTRYDEAAEYYRKALEYNTTQPIAANNLAWIYAEYSKGSVDEAMRLAQLASQQRPDVLSYGDTLGWVYHKKGLHAAAITQLAKVVSKAGDKPLYRFHLGMAYAKAGRKDEARRELEQALRLAGTGFNKVEETRLALSQL
jgi:tetratricopeptide (TPR) repeat protein